MEMTHSSRQLEVQICNLYETVHDTRYTGSLCHLLAAYSCSILKNICGQGDEPSSSSFAEENHGLLGHLYSVEDAHEAHAAHN